MLLGFDLLVTLATTVKKRGLDGELKVPLLLSSDDESKVSAHTKQGYTKKSRAAGAPRRPQNQSGSASSAESSDADDEEDDEEDEEEAPVIEPAQERYKAAIVLVNGPGNFEKTCKINDTLLGRVWRLESLDPERLKEGTSYLREVVFDAIPLDTNTDSFKRKTGFDYPGEGKIEMTLEDDLEIKLGAGATGTLTHIDDLSEDDRTDPKRCSEVWQIAKGSFKSKNSSYPSNNRVGSTKKLCNRLPGDIVTKHGAQTVFHPLHKPITVHGANDPLTRRLDETVTVACGHQRAIGLISKDVCEYDTFSSSAIAPAAPRVVAAHGALVDDDDVLVLKVASFQALLEATTLDVVLLQGASLEHKQTETQSSPRHRLVDCPADGGPTRGNLVLLPQFFLDLVQIQRGIVLHDVPQCIKLFGVENANFSARFGRPLPLKVGPEFIKEQLHRANGIACQLRLLNFNGVQSMIEVEAIGEPA